MRQVPVRTAVGRMFSREKKSCEGVVVMREYQSVDFRAAGGVDGDFKAGRELSKASPGVWLVLWPAFSWSPLFSCDGYEVQRLGHRMASLLSSIQPPEPCCMAPETVDVEFRAEKAGWITYISFAMPSIEWEKY